MLQGLTWSASRLVWGVSQNPWPVRMDGYASRHDFPVVPAPWVPKRQKINGTKSCVAVRAVATHDLR